MKPEALYKVPYGLYMISSHKGKKINGQIANALFQVTAEPPTVAISINKKNLTHEYISSSKVFAANILCQKTPMTFIGNFGFKSGRDINKFEHVNYKLGKTHSPILADNCLGYFEAEVIDQLSVGTHTIFVGKVVNDHLNASEIVLTYDYYQQVKGGRAPKTAPTYRKKTTENSKEEKDMDKYVCTVCGYVYDPRKGDSDNGVEPGTAFEDIPNDWVCPVCGAEKKAFEKEE